MSSASGRGMAQELFGVKPINGFHRDVELQSTIRLNGAGPDQTNAPSVTRPGAGSSIVYASRAIAEIVSKIDRERESEAPMLITGETGTGKELIARVVHDLSSRQGRVF